MRAAAPCMHHHLLPSERKRRCSALHPGPALPTSIDCHQVICFAVSPCCSLTHQRACSKQPRHVTRRLSQYFLPYRTVCTYVCMSAHLRWLPERVRARVSPSVLQGEQIRGPVSALWGDVSGRFGFPAGQIRIGSPMTAGLSCSVGHAAVSAYLQHLCVPRHLLLFACGMMT